MRTSQADRREVARVRRHEDVPDGELFGDFRGMERPGAAQRDQREMARIMAALHRDLADRAYHTRDGKADNTFGEPVVIDVTGALRERSDGGLRCRKVDAHAATEERRFPETTQHEV